MNEHLIRLDIVEIGKRLYQKEFVASNDGNISARLSENEILITPSGVSKGYMSTSDILKVDLNGRVLSGTLKPSSEMKMHLAVYRLRSDVMGVVHAHPQKATAFAVAGKVCDKIAVPEAVFSIGRVALTEYATPTTDEVPKSIEKFIGTCDAILLANHGALTVGKDLFDAYYKMETLEHFAGITIYARMLGGEKVLSDKQVDDLYRLRKEVYGKETAGINDSGLCGGGNVYDPGPLPERHISSDENYDELSEKIKNMVIKELSKLSR